MLQLQMWKYGMAGGATPGRTGPASGVPSFLFRIAPSISPLLIEANALGRRCVAGRPGMVMISPQITTIKPAPPIAALRALAPNGPWVI